MSDFLFLLTMCVCQVLLLSDNNIHESLGELEKAGETCLCACLEFPQHALGVRGWGVLSKVFGGGAAQPLLSNMYTLTGVLKVCWR